MSAYSDLRGEKLCAEVNRLRALWGGNAPRIIVRGGRYGCEGSVMAFHMSRADVVKQCESLEAGMQKHHDEEADKAIQDRCPGAMFVSAFQDAHRYTELLQSLRRVPQSVRLLVLAFINLSDEEMAS